MCGIAGCYNTPHAPAITRLGLFMLQHRGQEWVGMVSSDGNNFYPERSPLRQEGLVMQVLTPAALRSLTGHMAFGHVRYSTQGASELNNAQPHVAVTGEGPIFFASNGDLVNCHELRAALMREGVSFYGENDGEVIVKLIAHRYRTCGTYVEAIRQTKKALNGSYSGVLMTRDRMFLVRDHLENRPFAYAASPDGAIFFASESAALDVMTRDYAAFNGEPYTLLEVPGNEIIELAHGTLIRHPDPLPSARRAHCIFEMIYFSRPDSTVFGTSVKEFRGRMAAALVRETAPEGDLVSPIPDSGTVAAIAVSTLTGIPIDLVLFRHHYAGRTFTAPDQTARDFGVKLKFNADREGIAGKRVILVDDSIVRGTTMRQIIDMIQRCGPRQITLLITCPLILHPCYYGIDMKGNLIAQELKGNVQAIKECIGLRPDDHLHFLSLAGLRACVPDAEAWCFACLSGTYPTDVSGYGAPRA